MNGVGFEAHDGENDDTGEHRSGAVCEGYHQGVPEKRKIFGSLFSILPFIREIVGKYVMFRDSNGVHWYRNHLVQLLLTGLYEA